MSKPDFNNPSPEDLEQLRRFLEECDWVEVGPQVREIIEKHFPHLLNKLEPHTEH